ncbi:pyrroline-5-carboxylate reductase [Culicoidibacter larvae]|nr:pyrroline-5-carboxylate reductase [Culicoidibacter larvae]
MKIGFIGVGNMAQALIHGMRIEHAEWQLFGFDIYAPSLERAAANDGLIALSSAAEVIEKVDIVVLAIKPQQYDGLLKEISSSIRKEQIIVTIAIGFDIARTQSYFAEPMKIVRAMPNTPALIGQGVTGVSFSEAVTDAEHDAARTMFASCGTVVDITEAEFNIFGAVAGSLPAYVYIMTEALADAAVQYGLGRAASYEIISQAISGSAAMVNATNMHPAQLKDQVCSPNGTTIAAVDALEREGFRHALMAAVQACMTRTKELDK